MKELARRISALREQVSEVNDRLREDREFKKELEERLNVLTTELLLSILEVAE
jgi:hypothetical protein